MRGVFIFFEYNGLSQSKQKLLLQCDRNDITKFIGNTLQSHFSSFQVLLTSRSGSFDVHFKFDLRLFVFCLELRQRLPRGKLVRRENTN